MSDKTKEQKYKDYAAGLNSDPPASAPIIESSMDNGRRIRTTVHISEGLHNFIRHTLIGNKEYKSYNDLVEKLLIEWRLKSKG
jgi:hypothetical protein